MENYSIKNGEWLTPKELEVEYGITVAQQYKLRMKKTIRKKQWL